jgi:hypothetical protein
LCICASSRLVPMATSDVVRDTSPPLHWSLPPYDEDDTTIKASFVGVTDIHNPSVVRRCHVRLKKRFVPPKRLGSDNRLPLSSIQRGGATTSSAVRRVAAGYGVESRSQIIIRRQLGARRSIRQRGGLARTARSGLSPNEHSIPSVASIFAPPTGSASAAENERMEDEKGDRRSGYPRSTKLHEHLLARSRGFALNAYILDFYTHGQVQPLSNANGIRRGDVWFVLEEFDLTLKTVRGVLEQMIMKKPKRVDVKEGEENISANAGWFGMKHRNSTSHSPARYFQPRFRVTFDCSLPPSRQRRSHAALSSMASVL